MKINCTHTTHTHTMRIKILKSDRFAVNYKLYACSQTVLPPATAAAAAAAVKSNKQKFNLFTAFSLMIERMLYYCCYCWHHSCPFELNYTVITNKNFDRRTYSINNIILFDRLRSLLNYLCALSALLLLLVPYGSINIYIKS